MLKLSEFLKLFLDNFIRRRFVLRFDLCRLSLIDNTDGYLAKAIYYAKVATGAMYIIVNVACN